MKKPFSPILTLVALSLLRTAAIANPAGGAVTAGNITITGGPGNLTINQADMRGIIHWQDFSIGAGELTQFVQPGPNAATLNRVIGGIPTSIHGTLQANGHVFLINPNGILVGPTGVINTAGFVASTLDVPDAEFLAGGDMNFAGSSLAGVVNLGTITATAGDVALLGKTTCSTRAPSMPRTESQCWPRAMTSSTRRWAMRKWWCAPASAARRAWRTLARSLQPKPN